MGTREQAADEREKYDLCRGKNVSRLIGFLWNFSFLHRFGVFFRFFRFRMHKNLSRFRWWVWRLRHDLENLFYGTSSATYLW